MERIQRMEGFRFFKPCGILTPMNIHIHLTGEKGLRLAHAADISPVRPIFPICVHLRSSWFCSVPLCQKSICVHPRESAVLPGHVANRAHLHLRSSAITLSRLFCGVPLGQKPICVHPRESAVLYKIAPPVFSLSHCLVFPPTPP